MRTKTAVGLLEAQAMQNFLSCESQIFEQIACVIGQAAAMRVEITDRDFVGNPRIVHRKIRIEIVDFRVPGNFAFADKFRYDGRADGFGQRCKLEHGICVYRFLRVDIPHAKARCVNDLILKHDSDRETGDRTFFNLIFTGLLGFPHRLVHLLRRRLRSPPLARALVNR
jgi:hypothetical protein